MDITEIRSLLSTECALVPNRPILVGVSGGPDSVSLLFLLREIGFPVIAAHFDHQLRAESAKDAQFVKDLASSLKIYSVVESADVAEIARKSKLSLEEAARMARYRFLFRLAAEMNVQAVAVGHTADDQVETMLMHLLRGAGISGLKAMSVCSLHTEWSQTIPLIRPLLHTWREETVSYCENLGIVPVIDASNQDQEFFRNRLRHELIPFLESYNPRIKETLLRTTQTLASDYEVVQCAVQKAWSECRVPEEDDQVAFSLALIRGYERGIQRALIRQAIACLRPGLRDIDFASIERALAFIHAPSQSRRMDLTGGLDLYTDGKRVWVLEKGIYPIDPEWPQLSTKIVVPIDHPGTVLIGSGWVLETRVEPVRDIDPGVLAGQIEHDPFQACLDFDRLSFPLEVGTRRRGDRFSPLGMKGHSVKVSDFFVNVQLPRPARDGWPLVRANGRIAWIPGFRPSETYRVDEMTTTILRLVLYRSGLSID